jgi:hypothetical protein
VWNPKDLPVRGPWFSDGPLLPIEFARQSKDERITLVLCDGASPVRSLWALMSVGSIEEAAERLASRERIPSKNISTSIGIWQLESSNSVNCIKVIGDWATGLALDAVIWTALQPKFNGENGRIPSADEVLSHLSNLPYERRKHAEEYVRMAPKQIDTEYRRVIEGSLQWTCLSKI